MSKEFIKRHRKNLLISRKQLKRKACFSFWEAFNVRCSILSAINLQIFIFAQFLHFEIFAKFAACFMFVPSSEMKIKIVIQRLNIFHYAPSFGRLKASSSFFFFLIIISDHSKYTKILNFVR